MPASLNTKTRITLLMVVIFSIAMGFLETAVVVYLRELYFPDGFRFPLRAVSQQIAITELIREFSTIVMLIGIGFLAGQNAASRFGYFLLSFAVWDIFYYIFLYLILDWPVHILEWDILFLIPILWTGPVITPVIISLAMMMLGLIMIVYQRVPDKLSILSLLTGVLIALWAFMKEFAEFHQDFYSGDFSLKVVDLLLSGNAFIPKAFPWMPFNIGCLFIGFGIILYFFQIRKANISHGETEFHGAV
jgi:hypothetical protein